MESEKSIFLTNPHMKSINFKSKLGKQISASALYTSLGFAAEGALFNSTSSIFTATCTLQISLRVHIMVASVKFSGKMYKYLHTPIQPNECVQLTVLLMIHVFYNLIISCLVTCYSST